jgi:hypothetical protein
MATLANLHTFKIAVKDRGGVNVKNTNGGGGGGGG